MKNTLYGIGLDIGVASVGWAVVGLNGTGEPVGLHRLGVRIFDKAEQPKTGESLAAPRRMARGMRRRLRRKALRRADVYALLERSGLSTREAFRREREILQPLKDRADYTINTGLLSTSQNKERICDLFNQNGGAKSAMRLTVMSFGFKFGIPPEADLVLDVRCLPNPFYVPELKHKTGLDEEVVDFVMSHPEAQELLKRYESFLEYALPLYVKEGKSQLTIAVGCTGGKHRSITFARKIAEYCEKLGYKPGIQHRDSVR